MVIFPEPFFPELPAVLGAHLYIHLSKNGHGCKATRKVYISNGCKLQCAGKNCVLQGPGQVLEILKCMSELVNGVVEAVLNAWTEHLAVGAPSHSVL